MAKGKHAAAAARKRADEAERRADDLCRELEEARAFHRDEVASLRAEVQSLRNGIHGEAAKLSATRFAEAEAEWKARLDEADERAESRVRDGIARFSKGLTQKEITMYTWDDWEETARAFGISVADFLALAGKTPPENRKDRRFRAGDIKGSPAYEQHNREQLLSEMRRKQRSTKASDPLPPGVWR